MSGAPARTGGTGVPCTRAFLLAAGLGTRLRPLTETTPKCLVPIAGRPLLDYWLTLLERHGFTDVLVNLHHLPEAVRDYVAAHPTPLRVALPYEPVLLGSGGTLRANREWARDEPFLVAYADNLTNADLTALVSAHDPSEAVLTMALFEASEPSRCGIAEVDARDRIVGFVEKPAHPVSNLANAGLYVADARLFAELPPGDPCDFGHDVLPRLVGRMRGWRLREPLIDVGTWESYTRAQQSVAALAL